jgi:hypothetical protein
MVGGPRFWHLGKKSYPADNLKCFKKFKKFYFYAPKVQSWPTVQFRSCSDSHLSASGGFKKEFWLASWLKVEVGK